MARRGSRNIGRLPVRMLMTSGLTPKQVVKALRPAELTYLCEICAELHALGICDDLFFDEEDEDEDAEESD